MAAVLNHSKFTLIVDTLLKQTLGLQQGQASINTNLAISLAAGNLGGQADLVFSETRTLGASANASLDLNGSLKDAFNNAVNFACVKAIVVMPSQGNTNNVLVGGAGSNPFIGPFGADGSAIIQVRPGGMLALVCRDVTGWVVTPTSGDLLKFANSGSGTGVTYDVVIVGATSQD